MTNTSLPIAVIGAGPVGLAAAAHLLARGLTPLVLEAGPQVGHSVRQWGHVRMFTPWRWCIDRQAATMLRAAGWTPPMADIAPTGVELVERYLEPLAALPAMAPHILTGARVTTISRRGCDKVRTAGRQNLPFVLRIEDDQGRARAIEASSVIDASGTWSDPNPAGADGLPAIGETAAAGHIATGIPDVLGAARSRHAGRTTAVLGGGHSALNALIDLARLALEERGTRILWLMRKQRIETAFGGEEADGLPARGALGSRARELVETGVVEVITPFLLNEVRRDASGGLRLLGMHEGSVTAVPVDELIVATGFRPNLAMLREVRLALDPWLECAAGIGTLIDPNLHSCGTVRPHGARELAHPEPGFFIAGMKSYGRAPTFLLATGHEQVRSIAAHLAGDHAAAAAVELDLPETGVCSTGVAPRPLGATSAGPGCCTPQTAQGVCCAAKPELAPSAPCCSDREDALA